MPHGGCLAGHLPPKEAISRQAGRRGANEQGSGGFLNPAAHPLHIEAALPNKDAREICKDPSEELFN